MNLTYLHTFRVVALHRSFTRAAAELGYAQSSVTMQMQKLEQYYEVKLFERYGRGLRLTSAGDDVLKIALQMLELHQLSRESLARQSGGTLTIGTIDSIASYFLPAVIQSLRACYPELSIRIVTDREQTLINRVKEGELDVCLLLENEPPEPDLQWLIIREEPLVFLSNPLDTQRASDAVMLEELYDSEWIMAEESCNYRSMLERVLRHESIPYRIALEQSGGDQAVLVGRLGHFAFAPNGGGRRNPLRRAYRSAYSSSGDPAGFAARPEAQKVDLAAAADIYGDDSSIIMQP